MLGKSKKFRLGMFEWRSPGRGKKKNFPSWEPGPWSGTVCHTSGGEIIGTVSQEKWEKIRALVLELANMVAGAKLVQEQECKATGKTRKEMKKSGGFSDKAKLPGQRLLEIRVFPNCLVRTYTWLSPFMKGMHSRIDRWRYDRDSGDWKLTGKHLQTMLAERFQMLQMYMEDNARGMEDNAEKGDVAHPTGSDSEDPPRVLPVERLLSNVRALKKLTATKDPPRV